MIMTTSSNPSEFLPFNQTEPDRITAIVTDSIAQVPAEVTRQLNIHVIPFCVTVEGEPHMDVNDDYLSDLYRRMRHEKDLRLTTSAPSTGVYYESFLGCLNSGAENVVYVCIASRLSQAFSTAVTAARTVHEKIGQQPIYLIDTRLATAAQGYLAIEAARMAKLGANPQEISEHLESERGKVGFAAGLETLEYLARGGRIGKAAYMLGNAIHILPVVTLNDKGEVMPVSRRRGYKHVLDEIIRYVKDKVAGSSSLSMTVMHADVQEWAEELQTMAVEQFHPDEILITTFTPTMVAHTGPGIIGLAYHSKP
jgi:DegV family protein with EDD domain